MKHEPATSRTTTWQPIETAPRQRILLLFAATDIGENDEVRNWKMETGCMSFDGIWEWPGRLREWEVKPTHWMHLPEPPL